MHTHKTVQGVDAAENQLRGRRVIIFHSRQLLAKGQGCTVTETCGPGLAQLKTQHS